MILLLSLPSGGEWGVLFIAAMSIMLIPKIFYIITLQSTLNAISNENRKMPSGNVWLLLIPLFSIVWHFIVVNNIADSLRAEANAKEIKIVEPRPGYSIGLAMCILNCFFIIPGLNIFSGLVGFICWIIYWVKITGFKNLLIIRSGGF